jgi:hypothetical protein
MGLLLLAARSLLGVMQMWLAVVEWLLLLYLVMRAYLKHAAEVQMLV